MPILCTFVIFGVAAWNAGAKSVAAIVQESSNSSGPLRIWEPSTAEFWRGVPNATVPKEMVSKIVVSGAPIVLEGTSIIDIAKRFGATVGGRGEGGDSLRWICMGGNDSGGEWALWLESGEIEGGMIGDFQWRRVSSGVAFDKRCRKLKSGSVELPDRLRLGLTREEVKTILGEPTVWRGQRAIYVHEHTELLHGEIYTSDNIVEVRFHEGKVQAIDVSKLTSD